MPHHSLFEQPSSEPERAKKGSLEQLGDWLPDAAFFGRLAGSPLFWRSLAVFVVVLMLTAWGPAALHWGADAGASAVQAGRAALAELADVVLPAERSAFRIETGSAALAMEATEVNPALIAETLEHDDYRLDLTVSLGEEPVRFAVNAANAQAYTAATLRRNGAGAELIRQHVRGGAPAGAATAIPVPASALKDDGNKLSVVVKPESVTILLNGQGIDYFRDARAAGRGVGLFAAESGPQPVRALVLSGNDDQIGRFLATARAAVRAGS